jgi:hypothetical protein
MSRTFEQGEEVIFEATFYSDRLKTTPVDPSGVTLEIQKPDGTIESAVVATNGARPANVGKYISYYTVDDYGIYDWRWETGNPLFIRQGTIKVNPNLVS